MIYLTFRLLSFSQYKKSRDPIQIRNRVGRIRICRLLAWEGSVTRDILSNRTAWQIVTRYILAQVPKVDLGQVFGRLFTYYILLAFVFKLPLN